MTAPDSGATDTVAPSARKAPVKKSAQDLAIETLQREVQSLAVLIKSMQDETPDGTLRASRVNNLSTRLEKLEQQVQGEHGLMTVVREMESGIATDVDHQDVTELRRTANEVEVQLGQLKAAFEGYSAPVAVETVMSEIKQLRDHVDAVSRMQPGLDTVSSSLRDSLTGYIDGALEKQAESLAPLVQQLSGVLTRRIDSVAIKQGVMEKTVASLASLTEGSVAAGQPGLEATATTVPAVYGKVLALMDEIMFIGKDRRASGGGVNFKFRGIEDAQNAVGAAMRKVRVLLQPEVVSWEYSQIPVQSWDQKAEREKTVYWATSRLTMRYTFIAPEDGSRYTIEMVGEGKDNSDKSASKAASMACKYALFQALMIPFEDVDESDSQNDAIAEDYRQYNPSPQQEAPPVKPMTPDEKAAMLVQWVRDAQSQPGDRALGTLAKAKQRSVDHDLEDILIEGVPVKLHISTAMQVVNATIQKATAGAGQGVSRREQQAGGGARAAIEVDPDMQADLESGTAPDPGAPGLPKRSEYEFALACLRGEHGDLTDEMITNYEKVIRLYESAQS